jgi:hypothetical protein
LRFGAGRGGGSVAVTHPASNDTKMSELTAALPDFRICPMVLKFMTSRLGAKYFQETCQLAKCDE